MKNHIHDENCDHDHEVPMITITLEDDTEVNCIVINIFEFRDREYIAVLPEEDSEMEDEIHIFRYSEDGEYIDLDEIEDEEEFEAVSDYFSQKFEEELEELDEEELE